MTHGRGSAQSLSVRLESLIDSEERPSCPYRTTHKVRCPSGCKVRRKLYLWEGGNVAPLGTKSTFIWSKRLSGTSKDAKGVGVGFGVAVRLSMLACNTQGSPGLNVFPEAGPNKLSCHQLSQGFHTWVGKTLDGGTIGCSCLVEMSQRRVVLAVSNTTSSSHLNVRVCSLVRRHGSIIELQVDGPDECLSEVVGDQIVLAHHMADVRGELGNRQELALLMPGTRF